MCYYTPTMPKKGNDSKRRERKRPLSAMPLDTRAKMIRAFTRYCQGEPLDGLAAKENIPLGTLRFWQHSQNWSEGRRRLRQGLTFSAPFLDVSEPDDKHTMPESMEDLVLAQVVTRDIIKGKLGEVIEGMADAALKASGEENLEKSADIQRLTAAFRNVFPEKTEAEKPSVSINITSDGLRSMVMSDVTEFNTKLDIIEVEAEEVGSAVD